MSWPPAAGASLLDAVALAWRESVFAPGRFFVHLGHDQPTMPSLWYYMAIGIVAAGIALFWQMVLPVELNPMASAMAGFQPTNPLLDFLFTPVELIVSLLLTAGVVHLLLLILGGARNGFGTTVRVLCFASGPQLFAVVPVIGGVIGGIWMVVLAIVGLRDAHATSGARSAAAVLLPLLMLAVLALLSVLLLGIGRILA